MQDREYQLKAEDSVLYEYDAGVRRMLLSMATGTGKTIVFSRLYQKLKSRLPGQMLVLAHREVLVRQNQEKIQAINPTIKVDIEMAEHHADPNADVICASVATIGREGTTRGERFPNVDKTIVDEAHHSTAEAYGNVFKLFQHMDPGTRKLLLGVTATPQRADGTPLATVYEKIAYVYSIRQAIEDGWLVDIRGYRLNTDTDLSGVTKTEGDFAEGQLSDVVNNPTRNQQIVDAWKNTAPGRAAVAFTAGIQHAKDLSDVFKSNGVSAEAVWGDDPDRAEKLRLHREGKITVLCNCGVLVEGYDDWRIACVILARPTTSAVLFTQMVGRGTRLQDGLEKPPAPPTKTAEAEHRLEVSFVEGKVWVEASTFGVTDKSWFGLQKEAIRRRKMKNGMNYRVVRVHDEPRYKVERMTRNNRVWCRSILADREYSYAEANEKARDLSGQFTESIYRVTQV